MRDLFAARIHIKRVWVLALMLCFLALSVGLVAAKSGKMQVVPKWGRFEQSFRSSAVYSNPLQDTTLTVVFTSPLGETNLVYGFWDGGRVWRVRFAPDQPGRWSFKSSCSDSANPGLHNRTGEFICTAATGQSRFEKHGLIGVARDRRHFEHADGTPFFWLADTTWNGARLSEPKDWEFYAGVRVIQRFTVIEWAAMPGTGSRQPTGISGSPERIGVDPDFFKKLDRKVELLSHVGLLSAIAPLAETGPSTGNPSLPDDQAALLVRYIAARWGSDPVAWLVAAGDANSAQGAERWKKIGRAVFGQGKHGPVIVDCGTTTSLLNEFRDEPWVDALAFRGLSDFAADALKRTIEGSFAEEWHQHPEHPLLIRLPTENSPIVGSGQRVSADDARHAAYSSLLLWPPAGLIYSGQGVTDWDMSVQPQTNHAKGGNLPLWRKAIFMPCAKEMVTLAGFINSVEFWRLRPQTGFVASQPGGLSLRRYMPAAGTDAKDFAAVYVPEDRTLELMVEALPSSPTITWLNPRTGQTSPAVAVVGARTCQFPTPEPGDWLLTLKSGK
jgi:hypothetical protein